MNFGNSILHLILLSFNSSFKDALVVFKDYNELHYTMLTLLQIEAPLPVLCKLTVGEAGYGAHSGYTKNIKGTYGYCVKSECYTHTFALVRSVSALYGEVQYYSCGLQD
jgi:hypothetical protein